MISNRNRKFAVYFLLPAAILLAWTQGNSQEPKPAAAKEPTAEESFKNIQVLKGVPRPQFINAMQYIATSLGVGCDHCHVHTAQDEWHMESDDKPDKQTARKMMRMVQEINAANFEGHLEVSCATCHQGKMEPSRVPPLRALGVLPPDEHAQPELPKAEDVLAKYVAALGGPEAIAKIKSRVAKGTITSESNKTFPVEVELKSPGKCLVEVTTPEGPEKMGYDGAVGWGSEGGHDWKMFGLAEARMERETELFPAVDLKSRYPRIRVVAKDKMGDRDTLVVAARGEGKSERLCFDAENGLLLRRVVLTDSALGPYPEQVDYADYRDVDGVNVPFTIRRIEFSTRWTEQYSEVKHNVAIDDTKFAPPAGEKKQGL